MPLLRGYTRVPGSARRYRTPAGRQISRREYDNRRLRVLGFRNRYELERLRQSPVGRRWGIQIIENEGRLTVQDWADIREVAARRAAIGPADSPGLGGIIARDRQDAELIAPDGPLARVLDRSGRRPLSNRPVGAS